MRRTVHVRNYPEQLAHLAAGLPSGELTTALQGARQAAFTGDEQAAARQLGRAVAALHRTPLSDARRAEVLRAIVRAANVWQLTIPRLHVVQVGEHLWAIVRAQLARDGLENGPTAVARAARRTAATNRIGVVLRPGQLLVLPHFS